MSISFTSRIFSSGNAPERQLRGFTLIELMVSVSIIAIVSSIVVIRFSTFDSTVLLKSLAYEVALSMREAQAYSVSVRGDNSNFSIPYGLSFTPGSKEYIFFADIDGDRSFDISSGDTILNRYTIGRSMTISEICTFTDLDPNEVCYATRLDVTFERPEFSATFYADGGLVGATQACIKVQGDNPTNTWMAIINAVGQIRVVAGDDCNV